MKIAITGHTSGLGKFLFQEFSKEHNCIGFSRSNGYDLTKDFDIVLPEILKCDLLVNNSFACGSQIKYLESCKEMTQIVMGSIAARNPNPMMPFYCKEKKILEEYFLQEFTHNIEKTGLYLQLTGKSYKNPKLIKKTIDFWLANKQFNFIGFKTK